MNAINHTEAQAIHAVASAAPAALLEAADPSKNLILVPLSRLVSRPTGRNVRKTPRMSIPELAASIQRVGQIMLEFHIKRVPIIEGKKLVGIVSRADIIRLLLK